MADPLIGINDSRLGSVAREDVDAGCHIELVGIAELSVPLDRSPATMRIGAREVELSRRRRLPFPRTFAARCRLGDVEYRVAPRGYRLAELVRDRRMLAVLARPHRGDRIMRWDERIGPTDEEIALGHALAAYAGF